uniref:Uncharacterized protein n=1 Tax=Helianthus annuus TaxID=4232 RepID=A0A251VMM7_HELAN
MFIKCDHFRKSLQVCIGLITSINIKLYYKQQYVIIKYVCSCLKCILQLNRLKIIKRLRQHASSCF